MIVTQLPPISEEKDQQTWQFFWGYAASQIIISLSPSSSQQVESSFGCAIYDHANPANSLWLHPSSKEKQHIGDLSTTRLGYGTLVIPRNGLSYVAYLRQAMNVVKYRANEFFEAKIG